MFQSRDKRAFGTLLVSSLLTQALASIGTLVVAKLVMPEELGTIRTAQSYVGLLAILAGMGLSTSVLKYCSEPIELSDKEVILQTAVTFSVGSSTALLLLLLGLLGLGYIHVPVGAGLWFGVFCVTVPFNAMTEVLTSFLLAMRRSRELGILQIVSRLSWVIAACVGAWLGGWPGFAAASVISSVVSIALFTWCVRWKLVIRPQKLPVAFVRTGILSVMGSGLVCLREAGQFFILDRYITNRQEIGCFALATLFVLAATQVTSTAQSVVTPIICERASDRNWLRGFVLRMQTIVGLGGIAVAIIVFGLAVGLVRSVYDTNYGLSLNFLAVLLTKYTLWSASSIFGIALLGIGRSHLNVLVAAMCAIISLSFALLFVEGHGLLGVAWAQVVAELASVAMSYVLLVLSLNADARQRAAAERSRPSGVSL